jgi:hypothetical protein
MQRPDGVTILAVLAFIGAGLLVLAAMGMLLGGAMVANMAARPGFGMMAGVGGVVFGVFFLIIAGVYALVGTGFLKLQNWARILTIVLSSLGVLSYGLGILSALFHLHPVLVLWRAILLAINLWIVIYLMKPHVKQAFGSSGF